MGLAVVCEQNFKAYFVFSAFLTYPYLTQLSTILSPTFLKMLKLVTFKSLNMHKITPKQGKIKTLTFHFWTLLFVIFFYCLKKNTPTE